MEGAWILAVEIATMTRWAWKFPDYFANYGPVEAQTETEARELIRKKLRVSRLPKGLRVWDIAKRPMDIYVVREPLPLAM